MERALCHGVRFTITDHRTSKRARMKRTAGWKPAVRAAWKAALRESALCARSADGLRYVAVALREGGKRDALLRAV